MKAGVNYREDYREEGTDMWHVGGIWTLIIAIITILVGILVIVKPRILAWIVGIYLIVVGVLALIGYFV